MEFLNNVSNLNVMVIGDVMLDRYWWGSVSRISPEAPVPVVNLENISMTAGGAANVAANIAGLGARPLLVGIVGDDEEAISMLEILKTKNVSAEFLVSSKERRTTVKTRIVAHNQQVVRVDRETKINLSSDEEERIWKNLNALAEKAPVIILSDYGKGIITENLAMRLITSFGANKIILVDPKGKDYSKYTGATLLTPNRYELADVCSLEDYSQKSIEVKGAGLLEELSLKYLLVTQGEQGMTLFENKKKTIHLPVELRNVYDVTGAGDTVIACLAVAFGGGADFLEAAKFANQAAGLVVEQVGTTAITLEMLNRQRVGK